MSIAERYAAHCVDLSYEELPEDLVEYTKRLVLDTIGTAVGGFHWSDAGDVMIGAVGALGGDGDRDRGSATILATGERATPADAALANGALSHCLDYDNRHSAGALHVGSSVVTAALAAAEGVDAPGTTLLEGVVAGYDVAARLGMACNPRSAHERGFHPTGTCGTFGATAAAGTVLDLSADELVTAFGVNVSQASGSTAYHASGGWNKRLHPGLAARNAFVAIAFAENGFRGPSAPIGGELGFLEAYANRPLPDRAVEGLGEVYEAERTKIKPYPVGTFAHVPIALLLELVETHGIDPATIDEIVVEMPTSGAELFARSPGDDHPTSSVEAQFDMPFAAAMAVLHGEVSLTGFEAVLAEPYSPEFTRLMERTTTVGSEDLETYQPELYPARVSIEANGESYERFREWVHGEPSHPMDWTDLEGKVGELLVTIDEDTRSTLFEMVRTLERHRTGDLVEVIRL